jgi:hypothetical protein
MGMADWGMDGEFAGKTTATDSTGVHGRSSTGDKIALFRSLFRGREDVYPRRFESKKTGRSGYAPFVVGSRGGVSPFGLIFLVMDWM